MVVFSAPQLSLSELRALAELCDGRRFVKPLLAGFGEDITGKVPQGAGVEIDPARRILRAL